MPPFRKPQLWTYGPFKLSVENGAIAIGYEDEALTGKAQEVVKLYLAAHNLENGTNYHVDLNQSWRINPGEGKTIGAEFSEKVGFTASVSARITGRAHVIINGFDSESFGNQTALVEKCGKDPALASALSYFHEEVVDNNRPLYGIYKAVEALTKVLPGRQSALGKLAGYDKRYVGDVMQTAQLTRHHEDPNAKRVLTDEECKERAMILIRAYANWVQI